MLISVPFLVLTFLVYCFLPELRNLLGKSLMCYVVGLTVFYTSFLTIQLQVRFNFVTCKLIAYVAYISLLTCFFWLNVMSYDTWSSLRYLFNTHLLSFDNTIFFIKDEEAQEEKATRKHLEIIVSMLLEFLLY